MKNKTIYGAEIVDLSILIEDTMIIADLHLGYEQALNREGVMVPRFQYEKIITRIQEIKDGSSVSRVVVNGDLKHEFGRITRQERKEALNFIEFLKDNFSEVILLKGNHDNFTKFITQKTNLEVYNTYSKENFLIMHGDKVPDDLDNSNSTTLIIGHEHPCIGVRNGERLEKIKCFLKGSYKDKNLIVMPSFNFVTEGSDILHEKPLSPFLKKSSTESFDVYGVENFEVLHFGKIKDILAVRDKFY